MKLKVLGSSSSGNCYLLESEKSALIIEAGVKLKKIKIALDFEIAKVVGCIVTHWHEDHSKYVFEYMKSGIKVYAPDWIRGPCIEHKKLFYLDAFRIVPLKVPHNKPSFCFLIDHKECGTVLFATDLHYLPYKIQGLNQILIEANYDQKILDENVINGKLLPFVRANIIQSHMSIDTVKGIMKSNDLTRVNNIVLIHLSNGNSDAKRFKSEIRELTGKKVTIAEEGLEIEFNKSI